MTEIIEKIWIKFFKIGFTSIEAISDSFSFKTNGLIHTLPSYQPDSSYSTFSDVNLLNTWFQPRYNLIEINRGIDKLLKKLNRIYLKIDVLKYVLLSFFSSLSVPLLISIRLYLGWNHVFKRLTSEKVEYEESGWYDGQVWEKPLVLKEKESLIASIEVKPILKNLIQISSIICILGLSGILLFQYHNFKWVLTSKISTHQIILLYKQY